ALITESFAQWPPKGLTVLPPRRDVDDVPTRAPALAAEEVPVPYPQRRYLRRGDVTARRFGGALFLAQAEERRGLRLNPGGGAGHAVSRRCGGRDGARRAAG